MRIGICFFMESNLGGAATQADDLVTVAKRLGHQACLLRFTTSPRAKGLFNPSASLLPSHKLIIGRSGIRFSSEKLLVQSPAIIQFINTFDLLIFVGGCPHITRSFATEDFADYYEWLYSSTPTVKKYIFLTDPFWQKLYPYMKPVIKYMNGVYAFAEAYRTSVMSSGIDKVSICNFGSIAATDTAKCKPTPDERNHSNTIVWPHQWRSWKNPLLMLRLAPYLGQQQIRAFSDGIEYHTIRRDYRGQYNRAVRLDLVKHDCDNNEGTVTYYGTVPQSRIIQEFGRCRWMLDLTGMSGRTGKPMQKFIGNYQCVNLEAMMLGCVNFKYENTVFPFSQIPKECCIAMPLVTEPKEVAAFISKQCATRSYTKIAGRAKEWAIEKFDPFKVFKKCFLY